MKTFDEYVGEYQPSAEHNDWLWAEFSELANAVPFLKEHRDWVETHAWGFGDRAFHYMWYLLLSQKVLRSDSPALLEIGVYKGQVLSLWALIATQSGIAARIVGVSPLEGESPNNRFLHRILKWLNARYRAADKIGNLYPRLDYLKAIRQIFDAFRLEMSQIQIIQGKSQDASVKAKLSAQKFDIIYIDGDHSYDGARQDILFYSTLLKPNGYLVLDDASYFQPSNSFFKGHEQVSRAAEEIDTTLLTNVLNIGHNRIYVRN